MLTTTRIEEEQLRNQECMSMRNVSKEGIVKTGKDANQEGLYISECCNCKKVVHEGDMLPRCPNCLELAIWELADDDVVTFKEVA